MAETCKILGFTYQIKEVDEISRTEDLNGLIVYDDLTIYLEKNLPEEKRRETLLHEVIHGISEGAGIGLTEKAVQVLSRTLYSFFEENTAISSYLVAGKEPSLPQT